LISLLSSTSLSTSDAVPSRSIAANCVRFRQPCNSHFLTARLEIAEVGASCVRQETWAPPVLCAGRSSFTQRCALQSVCDAFLVRESEHDTCWLISCTLTGCIREQVPSHQRSLLCATMTRCHDSFESLLALDPVAQQCAQSNRML
jgi:hypothetical protein